MKLFGREVLFSLLLHVFLVASVFAIGAQIGGESEPVVIFLGADGAGSQAGGGGSMGQVQGKVARRGRQYRKPTSPSHAGSSFSARALDSQPQPVSTQEKRETETTSGQETKNFSKASEIVAAQGTGGGSGGGSGEGSGTGNGLAEGSGSGEGSGTGSLWGHGEGYGEGNAKQRYLREHFAYIRDLILKHLAYPPQAKKFGWMGSLTVSFVIRENGITEQIRIVKSSGYEILDQNVVRTIKDVQPFPKPPVKAELIIPVMYRLH